MRMVVDDAGSLCVLKEGQTLGPLKVDGLHEPGIAANDVLSIV